MDEIIVTRTTDRLAEAIATAITDNQVAADGREIRRDGWTAERIRIFLETLGTGGSVTSAARAAGVSARSAYKFRARAQGRGFDRAWCIALQIARPISPLQSRALHGCVDIIIRKGRVWGERHRYDNRATLAALARLDRKAEAAGRGMDSCAAVDFDTLVEIACGDTASRRPARQSPEHCPSCELSAARDEPDGDARPEGRPDSIAFSQASRSRARAIARRARHFCELRAIGSQLELPGNSQIASTAASVLPSSILSAAPMRCGPPPRRLARACRREASRRAKAGDGWTGLHSGSTTRSTSEIDRPAQKKAIALTHLSPRSRLIGWMEACAQPSTPFAGAGRRRVGGARGQPMAGAKFRMTAPGF